MRLFDAMLSTKDQYLIGSYLTVGPPTIYLDEFLMPLYILLVNDIC